MDNSQENKPTEEKMADIIRMADRVKFKEEPEIDEALVSDEELENILVAVCREDAAVPDAQVMTVVDWAERAKLDSILYNLVQDGRVGIRFKNTTDTGIDDIMFYVIDPEPNEAA